MTARLIYSTWPDAEQADACAAQLVENRLAACVTILPGARSTFRWDNRVQQSAEAIMLVKTDAAQADALLQALRTAHPYDVPCILAINIEGSGSNPEFIQWIATETMPFGISAQTQPGNAAR